LKGKTRESNIKECCFEGSLSLFECQKTYEDEG